MSTKLTTFLGVARWRQFWSAIRSGWEQPAEPTIALSPIILSLLVGITAPAIAAADHYFGPKDSFLTTLGFGVTAVLALLIRSRLGLLEKPKVSFFHSLSLTHTAFALGCIPALAVVALSPNLLAERAATLGGTSPEAVTQPTQVQVITFILAIAAWAAVTEEVLFRGLLIGVIRRARLGSSQRTRDIMACVLSASLFGLSHVPLWGWAAGLSLTGLGLGFALGYLANGERLAPLMVYHFAFDVLSIGVAMYTR